MDRPGSFWVKSGPDLSAAMIQNAILDIFPLSKDAEGKEGAKESHVIPEDTEELINKYEELKCRILSIVALARRAKNFY